MFSTAIFTIQFCCVIAQQPIAQICNQFTKLSDKYKMMIPKDFCMPSGYLCYYLINDRDLTSDGKNDLVIHWQKLNMKDGDTTFVTIYQRINDSTLIHKATLSNLYPLYFKEYVLEYDPPKDLENIFSKLAENAQRFKVEFRKNEIWIELFTEAQAGVDLFFKYNTNKENWYLIKEVYWFGDNLRMERKIRETKTIKNGMSIQQFNMFDYLDD